MLTEGAIRTLYNSVNDKSGQTANFNPVVQVIDVKKIQGGSGASAERYRWVKFVASTPNCCRAVSTQADHIGRGLLSASYARHAVERCESFRVSWVVGSRLFGGTVQ